MPRVDALISFNQLLSEWLVNRSNQLIDLQAKYPFHLVPIPSGKSKVIDLSGHQIHSGGQSAEFLPAQ